MIVLEVSGYNSTIRLSQRGMRALSHRSSKESPMRFSSLTLAAMAAAAVIALPAAAQDAPANVTFTRDIAPIFQRSCQSCHRTGSIAPMSLLTYEEVRPWARSIKQRIESREMPPWFIDRHVGVQGFKADKSLSDAEIAIVSTWVDNGAPRGNPADLPPPIAFDDMTKWNIGEPDWVVEIPEPFVVKAEAADWWGNLVSDSGLTEDRWVKAVETKPTEESFPVVHHAVTTAIDPDGEAAFLNEYALGKNGDIYPDGTGRLLKAGSQIRFNMHYHAIGREITDRTSVGLTFYPKGVEPERPIYALHIGDNEDLDIPAGEADIRHDGYYHLKDNITLTVFQPHLHNLGTRQCIEAILPDNSVQSINCANWDFGWHIAYNYEDGVAPLIPKGSVIHVISWHDNSDANRWNDDPRNWAGFGQRSNDDMSFAWLSWFTMNDTEFEAAVAAREAATDND
tara:strand:- start:1503 stop:2861 length:1359 start_codon:yes stop_codon:yes gene_type:complete